MPFSGHAEKIKIRNIFSRVEYNRLLIENQLIREPTAIRKI
jgi:hypothetical protein